MSRPVRVYRSLRGADGLPGGSIAQSGEELRRHQAPGKGTWAGYRCPSHGTGNIPPSAFPSFCSGAAIALGSAQTRFAMIGPQNRPRADPDEAQKEHETPE